MSDLVERLREHSPTNEWCGPNGLFHEAADRIEELEALTKADGKEIGSYLEGTGLRGENSRYRNALWDVQAIVDAIVRKALEGNE